EPFTRRPVRFLGRAADLHAVLTLLAARRAVLVKGVSGVGKTELAKESAHWLVARGRVQAQRIFFVALLNAASAAAVRDAIASALNLKLDHWPDDAAAAAAVLAQHLPPASLLILDEAENVIDQDGLRFRQLVETLAGAHTRPQLIITSQSDVNSAHVPVYTLPQLAPQAAFDLFATTANLMDAELRQMQAAEIHALLAYVDCLPRAIELVAAVWRRTRSLDLQPLLQDLHTRRDQVMADPRYPLAVKSVTVGIQLAYDRLRGRNAAAAEFYAQLALFPGGLSEAGAAAIFGDGARAWLADIQDQSLLDRRFANLGAELVLLYLPAPLRFFAERQLPTGLDAAQAVWGEAALRFYIDFDEEPHRGWADQLDDALTSAGDGMGALIVRYTAELPSIEAWLDWAYAHEAGGDGRSRSARLTALLQNL
ncbi:MAG: ATP-binding protein, partial [Chloroflexota bacterium]|nr:ATP-binding protein [Chloroflexota bacterium]